MASNSLDVAVIGAGMMGRGIAAVMSANGHRVALIGRTVESAAKSAEEAAKVVDFLQREVMPAGSSRGAITATTLEDGLPKAAFVFESVYEDLEAKRAILLQAERLCSPTAILCTNTSSLSVSEIQQPLSSPGRFAAAHFIGPAHLMPLVEVCGGPKTDRETVDKVASFLRSVGKKPAVMKGEIKGFIAARLQAALYREAMHIVREGAADAETIDTAVFNGFGRRLNVLGPFMQADLAGVDLVQKTHATMFPTLGNYERDLRADELVAEGRVGAKCGKGHYEWPEAKKQKLVEARDKELLRRLKQDFEGEPKSKL